MIHELRNDPAFVKELDFVMELDGRIIGQNMFMHAATCLKTHSHLFAVRRRVFCCVKYNQWSIQQCVDQCLIKYIPASSCHTNGS